MRAALAVILLTIATQAGAAEYECGITKKLKLRAFNLIHSLPRKSGSSILVV